MVNCREGHSVLRRRWFLLVITHATIVTGYFTETRGPRFTLEPPQLLTFSNSSGARLDCEAEGSPPPRVEWLLADGSPVLAVPSARIVLGNGSLVFPAFPGEAFRPDVHSATYRCTAANTAGRIVSLDVQVRAVVLQQYEIRVYDAHVLPGNLAVLRCHVPSFARDWLSVTSWLQDDTFNIYPSTDGDAKHLMLPSGELHVLDAGPSDSYSSYRCRTLHALTGRTQESVTAGKIVVTEPKGPVAPRLGEKTSVVVARRGEDAVIPCTAQGHPPPSFWWFRKMEDAFRLEPMGASGERRRVLGGSLLIRSVQPSDAGFYVCSANNTAGSASLEVQLRVLAQLSVQILPPALLVDAGQPAELTCSASGLPAPEIFWLKDGQRLRGQFARDPRLKINSVQREDQGMYQCVARSETDSAHAVAELRLGASKPQLLYKFIQQTLQPGPDVSLKCIATGQPTPQVHWSLDGFPLPQSDRFVIGQYVTLTGDVISHVNISKVKVEDGGTYQCFATNRAGRVEHAASLHIYGLPMIRKMPSISAVAGEPLSVTCPAAGYPLDSITWEKDGRLLPTNRRQTVHPNGTLEVSNVQQRADRGTYTCEAKNRQGHSDRGSVEITVTEPPSIYPFSIQNSLHLGERIGLQCVVTKGDPPLTIEWLKDGESVASLHDLSIKSLGDYSSTLMIERLATTHSGSYTCTARNSAATASHSVQLAVNVPPEITPFTFQEITEGERVQVQCIIKKGDLPLNITWMKNSQPLMYPDFNNHDNLIHITDFNTYSSILTINSVSLHHRGNYTCVARNPAKMTSYTAHLKISVPPEWRDEPRDASAIAGQSVSISCQADGFPQPQITWRKTQGKNPSQFASNAGTLEEALPVLENGTLFIHNVREEHEGFYMCEANNGIGAGLSAMVFLTVNALPRFALSLRRETVRRGAAANFVCEAYGDRPMQIVWKRDGVRIAEEINQRFHVKETSSEVSVISQLTIKHTSTEDSGKFVCIATNPFGKDEMVVELTVQDVPTAPTELRVVECRSRTVKLVWNEPHDGNSPVLHYTVHYSTNPDHWTIEAPQQLVVHERTSAEVDGLRPSTTYFFRVSAVNQLGSGLPSGVVSAATELEAPTGPPLQLRATPSGPRTLHVTWSPPQSQLWNGPILGYYLGIMQVSGTQERRYNFVTVKTSDGSGREWILRDLASYAQYAITVQAFNAVGAGPSSPEITATTLEAAPNAPVQDLHCKPVDSQSLQVTWSPPPTTNQNGIIQGYKLRLESAEPENDLNKVESQETSDQTIVLRNLQKFTNYSVRVSAFTSAGVGGWSEPINCLTDEDVPGAPAGIQAVLNAPNSAIVSWSAPLLPNGILTQYHVYEREVRRGVANEPTRRTVVANSDRTIQALPLREHSTYEYWVTAATRIGEGPSTRVYSISPSSRVPAAIVTFDSEIVAPWRTSLILPCVYVGRPAPELSWTLDGRALQTGSGVRHLIMANGSLALHDLQHHDSGNYSCRASNVHGTESITHALKVLVPPSAPALEVSTVTPNNVSLRWNNAELEGAPSLLGFVLNMKKEYGEWQEIRLPRDIREHTVVGLPCGTLFYFYVSAVNRVGTGDASQVRSVRTRGLRPTAPSKNLAASSGQRSVTIHLERWQDGECTLQPFVLERLYQNDDWRMVTDEAAPGSSYTITGLEPTRTYQIRVTAQNNRGTTITVLKITTLNIQGGTTSPVDYSIEATQERPFYSDLRISLPISISVLAVVLTITTVLICLRRKSDSSTPAEQLNSTSGPQTPAKTDYYNTLPQKHASPSNRELPPHADVLDRGPEYGEDIYPYATFQVAQKPPETSSQRGFQTFVYHDARLLGPETMSGCEQIEAMDYMGSTRRSHRSKCLRSDSEEYDSLGSDSDTEHATSSRTESSNQLEESQRDKMSGFHGYLHGSNIRHSRLLSVFESSTSTEPSPPQDRKLARKMKMRTNAPRKTFPSKLATSSSSNIQTKETAFTFPAKKSTVLRGELSEAECDINSSPWGGISPFKPVIGNRYRYPH